MGKRESDQHRQGYERGVSGQPEYKWNEFYKTGSEGQARREGYNSGREDRARHESEQRSRDKK